MTSRNGYQPLGWGAASRLVDGKHGGPGTEELDTLLAVASAPIRETTADSARLATVLAAYRRAGAEHATAHRSVTRRPASRSALAKCAVFFLIFSGSSVAAASAGILPASVQRMAHDYFGDVGIPAPSSHGTAVSSPSETPSASGSPAATTPRGTAQSSAAQITMLCQKVAANMHNWRAGLNDADQSALLTAAGSSDNVRPYCAALLAQSSSAPGGPSAMPSPSASAPSPTASPEPTDTHGSGHVNHSPSPNPHSTGH